jgi:hypothetical protein
MKISWTNDDRSAIGQWATTSLGDKFFRWLREERPEIPDTLDTTALAIAAAEIRAYDKLLKKIEEITKSPARPAVQERQFVEVETD